MKNMFIAFLLGVILGAAGYWYVLQLPVQQAGEQAQQKATEAAKAASDTAAQARQAMAAKLEALPLKSWSQSTRGRNSVALPGIARKKWNRWDCSNLPLRRACWYWRTRCVVRQDLAPP